jgi:hypothetical protein
MALVLADRVLETSTTSGSGTISLAGASVGYQGFSTGVGNGNQTYYTIALEGGSEWEVGIGTYTSVGDLLSRDTVLASSASGAKVTFSAGVKQVFVTYPAGKSVFFTQSGTISASSGRITDVATPTASADAATKQYVDDLTTGNLHIHEPVVLATPGSSGRNDTYNNGTAGVSATLTATANGTLVIDSTVAQAANRVLIKDCDDPVENGVYVVTTVGTASTPYVMTRSSDADTSGEQTSTSLDEGSYFFVSGGTSQKGASYVCTTIGEIIFGTTPITFAEFSISQVYQAGTGIDITNTTISLQTPVAVANGGTGTGSTPTDGQLLTGNGSGFSLNTLKSGTGISVANAPGSITITNTAPDQTVAISAGTGITVGGGYPSFTISSTAGVDGPILESEITIDQNYTLTTGKNGLSVGPVTISPGYNVTVPAGQTWVVLNQASGSGAGTIATVGKAIAMSIVFGG